MTSMFDGPFLRIDERALDSLLHSTRGPVGLHMRRIMLQILAGARKMVGVRSGALRRSLYTKHARTVRGQYIQVGSNLNYALVHHEGAKPHTMTMPQGRIMRFNAGGRVVYARRVNHPGFRGRKYLTVPMHRAVRR